MIPLADVNVSTDIALCRQCGKNFSYAELVVDQTQAQMDLTHPPKGAWFLRDPGGFEVGASTRHPSSFFLVPFMMVWSGFSLEGIYGTQIVKGEFNLTASLFGIPFLLGTGLFGSIALMTVFGKTSVKVVNDQATLFTGVGPVGWRRRFKWSEVRNIRETVRNGSRGGATEQITIDADRRLDFAAGLNSAKQEFLIAALRQMWRR